MRRACIALLLLLPACRGEPDFDERYDRADKAIASKAAAIDAELAGKPSDASQPAGARR